MPDSTKAKLDITAIVIAYKSEDRIVEAIEMHERALADLDAEILIIDNASGDKTVDLARSTLRRGRVIANEDNVGYGQAANQGISEAKGRACLILNDDVHVTGDAIDKLMKALYSNEKTALVGPRLADYTGQPMPSARFAFPGPAEELRRLAAVVRGTKSHHRYPTDATTPTEVAWLVGACILGKTQILREIGGFNPAFFLYAEDIDLCRRMKEFGYRVVTVSAATCTHKGGVSTSQAFSDRIGMRRRADAREIFYRMWYPRLVRSLIHVSRAIGLQNQPTRLEYHLPKVFRDGGSLAHLRFPPVLDAISSASQNLRPPQRAKQDSSPKPPAAP